MTTTTRSRYIYLCESIGFDTIQAYVDGRSSEGWTLVSMFDNPYKRNIWAVWKKERPLTRKEAISNDPRTNDPPTW